MAKQLWKKDYKLLISGLNNEEEAWLWDYFDDGYGNLLVSKQGLDEAIAQSKDNNEKVPEELVKKLRDELRGKPSDYAIELEIDT